MDVLRKELNGFYQSQHLERETLDYGTLNGLKGDIAVVTAIDGDCRIITDVAADTCFISGGSFPYLIGISDEATCTKEVYSSDEDEIYMRLHPEDLVDKRMLEYEFFKKIDKLPDNRKLDFKATCRIRIRNREGVFLYAENTTQILSLSPGGKVWLILCCYNLSPNQCPAPDISPCIVDRKTGSVENIQLSEKRADILTPREKMILRLISEGKLSKQIASILGISINTVNRHRQNILEKLSVSNSVEAVSAATIMRLL